MSFAQASGEPAVLIMAHASTSLVELCGISMIERVLRTLERLGFRHATVMADAPEVSEHLAKPSWARAELRVELSMLLNELSVAAMSNLLAEVPRVLILDAGYFYDSRLLRALAECEVSTLLVDSSCGENSSAAALLTNDWRQRREPGAMLLAAIAEDATVTTLDAAKQPIYVAGMRRNIRPRLFPAPATADAKITAEALILDQAQNGTLDLPALVHAPIETWIVSRLCWTRVTPNEVTFSTLILGIVAAALFASGRFGWGVGVALVIGVLDGVDGKLARVKVETTRLGSWEHSLDYAIELSWWSALAFQLQRSGKLAEAYAFLVVLVVTDLLGRVAKRRVKQRLGRNLDDVSEFDRMIRYVAGRRNIYLWMFAVGLVVAEPANAFVALCCWGAISAAIHATRSMLLCRATTRPIPAQAPRAG